MAKAIPFVLVGFKQTGLEWEMLRFAQMKEFANPHPRPTLDSKSALKKFFPPPENLPLTQLFCYVIVRLHTADKGDFLMKKYIAFLLCLIMILSLLSCNGNNINEKENDHTNNDTTDEITSDNPSQENVVDYSKILNMYRSIIEILPNYVDSKEAMNDYCAELGILNE